MRDGLTFKRLFWNLAQHSDVLICAEHPTTLFKDFAAADFDTDGAHRFDAVFSNEKLLVVLNYALLASISILMRNTLPFRRLEKRSLWTLPPCTM